MWLTNLHTEIMQYGREYALDRRLRLLASVSYMSLALWPRQKQLGAAGLASVEHLWRTTLLDACIRASTAGNAADNSSPPASSQSQQQGQTPSQ